MKVVTYRSRTGGAAIPDLAVHMERLLFVFARIQGGAQIDLPTGWASAPDDYSLWRTAPGEVMAVRDGA
jgi:hypothetical protein